MRESTTGRLRVAAAAIRLGWRAAPWLLTSQLALALLTGIAPTITAVLGKLLLDDLTVHRQSVGAAGVAWLAGGIAVGTGLSAVLSAAASLARTASGRSIKMVAQGRLYERVSGFPGLRPFEDPHIQDAIRLAEQASQDAPQQVLNFLITVVGNATTAIGFLGTVLAVWPLMGLLMLACVGVSSIGQIWLAKRQVATTKLSVPAMRRQFFFKALMLERRAAMEIRLFGTGRMFHQRMMDALQDFIDADALKDRRDALIQSALAVLTAVAAAIAGIAVAERVLHDALTAGEMTLFTAAVAAVQSALASTLTQMGRMDQSLRLFSHYLSLLQTPDDLPDGRRTPGPMKKGITFEDVWFRYGETGPWVLRGLDLRLPHGKALGLVGVNGAGKSTLIKLLCRFYDPERGRILWDGVDIREFALADLRSRIGATFQEYMTYDLSARENIGVGDLRRMPGLERIRAAASLANIDETLGDLPDGYNTILSRIMINSETESGVLLSGGQWQRVALARSLLRDDADLLILDEPSSGLDPMAERHVHDTLTRHRAGRTSLLISHRLAALRQADEIAVLAGGRIVEQGSHQQLLDQGGHYADLFLAQAEGYQMHQPIAKGA